MPEQEADFQRGMAAQRRIDLLIDQRPCRQLGDSWAVALPYTPHARRRGIACVEAEADDPKARKRRLAGRESCQHDGWETDLTELDGAIGGSGQIIGDDEDWHCHTCSSIQRNRYSCRGCRGHRKDGSKFSVNSNALSLDTGFAPRARRFAL